MRADIVLVIFQIVMNVSLNHLVNQFSNYCGIHHLLHALPIE